MIPRAHIVEWRSVAPWRFEEMTEQDLIICRAVVELFSHPVLAERLAFRGGTALHRLHLAPATRYSEDVDLVQAQPGPIGPVFDALRERLDPWLGKPRRDTGPGIVTLTYRVRSATVPPTPLRLKVEIHSREHFDVLGLEKRGFSVASRWFTGHCQVPTYRLAELLGSKLRALYQRRKGRDLFDLWYGLSHGGVDPGAVVTCFHRYMEHQGVRVSASQFRANMALKLGDDRFLGDTTDLLRTDVTYAPAQAYERVDADLLARL